MHTNNTQLTDKQNFFSLKQAFRDKILIILLILGIFFRLSWCIFFPTYPETDFMWYHTKASELAEGSGFLNGVYPYYTGNAEHPTAFRPIGYPATLAVVYLFTGSNILAGKILNVFLSSFSILLLYCISRRFFGKNIALLATALFTFSPLSIVYTGILGSETLFCSLLLLSAYFTIFRRNPIYLGLIIGYLSLVRPIGIYFVGVIALYFLFDRNIDTKRKSLQIASVVGIMLLIITPWIIRNYISLGTPVYSTNGGYVIYVNNNPYANGSWNDPYKYPNSPFLKYKHKTWFDELGMNKEGKKLAVEWIFANPKSFLKLAVQRMTNSYWSKLDDIMWGFTTGINTWHPLAKVAIKLENIIYKPFNLLVFLSVFLTLIKFFKKQANDFERFVLLTFLYFNAMMFILEGNSRYLFPLHPFYSLMVAALLYNLYTNYSTEVNYDKIESSNTKNIA